jgi:phage baseplate assembly protein W
MPLDYPFRFDGSGRTAMTGEADHVRDLIEQVLFTAPGERVNRPTFGSGLTQLVFAPNSDALAAATQVSVHGALQQWLGDVLMVEAVETHLEDAALRVTVRYVLRQTQERRSVEVARRNFPVGLNWRTEGAGMQHSACGGVSDAAFSPSGIVAGR